jgi:hypothetical protein
MATDPGDLVLDPTCGSGTTAYVAEQWGRRWIFMPGLLSRHDRSHPGVGDSRSIASLLEKTIHELNADLPVVDVITLELNAQIANRLKLSPAISVGAFGLHSRKRLRQTLAQIPSWQLDL